MKKVLICLSIIAILTLCVSNVAAATTSKYLTSPHSKILTDAPTILPYGIIIVAPDRAKVNETFDVSGFLTVGDKNISGARVYLVQSDLNGNWYPVGDTVTDKDGNFYFHITPHTPGEYAYQVFFYGDSQYAKGVSNPSYTIVS